MSYPVIGKAEARAYLGAITSAVEADAEPPAPPEPRSNDAGPDEDWDGIATEIFARLDKARVAADDKGQNSGSYFEVVAGPEIHAVLPDHPALADPEFWIWLALVPCASIVRWRYGEGNNTRNFGLGGPGENFMYRLWLRAEIGYFEESDDVYALARVGDIDFWRSHVFRQGYGDVRHFVRALVRYQFPADNGGKPRLKTVEIRELAKRLKRARSNLMFELMTMERASQFIESEWETLAFESA
ncbi:hypothetical protein [Sphingopyxis chilensis]|uniref:hypothetical protein n=1 Tax=Sphingopyxis chilensis TaxID=180400 RepID=UPI002DDD4AD1|nr:hypothetical protein [Sphingopyxis chilensis]